MVATFNGNLSTKIISCYSPTSVSEETDLIAFYNELSSLVRSIPKHNVLVIGGDLNARIGKQIQEVMRPEQPQSYTMTGPFLTGLLEMNIR